MKKRYLESALIITILLIGAYLRLNKIEDYMTFLGDEGRDVLVVKRMIVDHKFTLLGPTASVGGFFLGPIYYYFMLPFLWAFNLNPVGPAIMVALFGIATIYLVFIVGKKLFDLKTAFIASSLYAISPYIIAYSRSSWNPNIIPFFSLLIIYLTWIAVVKEKWNMLFWVGILTGIIFQLHYLASFLTIGIIIYILIYGKEKRIKEYALGILGFIIGFSPFLLFEVRHGFPNTKTLSKFLFQGKEVGLVGAGFFITISDVTFRLWHRLVTNNNLILTYIILSISLIVFFITWYKKRKNISSFKTHLLIFIWGFISIILFGFYKKGIYDYYFGIMYVLPFLLVGNALSYISKNIFGKIIAIIIFITLIYVNWEGRPFRFPANRQLNQTKEIANFVLSKTEGKPFNFALITDRNSDHAYRYFFEISGNKPITIENNQNDKERKTVTDQLLIICERENCQPLGNSLWEVAGFGRAELAGDWKASVVKVYKLIHYKENN